jgi:hypothetical protein
MEAGISHSIVEKKKKKKNIVDCNLLFLRGIQVSITFLDQDEVVELLFTGSVPTVPSSRPPDLADP